VALPAARVGILVLAVAGFHIALWLLGLTLAEAQAAGWVPRTAGGGARFSNLVALAPLVNWPAVALVLPAIQTVAFLTLTGALMSTSALEAVTGEDADANRELRLTGLANLGIACMAGPPALSGFVSSLMAIRGGVTTCGPGLVMSVVLVPGLAAAGTIIATIPVFVMAGLILYLGLDLMADWLVRTRRTFGTGEWLVVVVIVSITVSSGFVAGLLAGLVIACLCFVWSYSAVPMLRRSGLLRAIAGTLRRSPADAAVLDREGDRVAVVALQSYLFFGTSERLRDLVRRRLMDVDRPLLLRVVLDLRHVVGLDAAAAAQLLRIATLVTQHGADLVLSGCSPALRDAVLRAAPGLDVRFLPEQDEALEQAEDGVLAREPRLQALWLDTADMARLEPVLAALVREHLPQGSIVLRAGDPADSLVFLDNGSVVVRAPSSGPQEPRLRAMPEAAIPGDIGLALGRSRTADVIAATGIVIRRLTQSQLARIDVADPAPGPGRATPASARAGLQDRAG